MAIHPSVINCLQEEFCITVQSTRALVGYETQNYKVSSDQDSYIVKVTKASESAQDHAHREYKVLDHIHNHHPGKAPRAVLAINGKSYAIKQVGEDKMLIRVLCFVEGKFVKSIDHNEDLFYSFGHFVGIINSTLSTIDIGIGTSEDEWDLAHFLKNRAYLSHIKSPSEKSLLEYFFQQYEERVEPLRYQLRKSLIHNDANDNNVLTTDGIVSGIIDFGDMAYTWSINDLAIGLAYILMDKEELVAPFQHVVNGFHKTSPLSKEECGVLYYLIAARLSTTICHCAKHIAAGTDTEYILVDYKRAQRLLKRWISISPILIELTCRRIAGCEEYSIPVEDVIDQRKKYISSSLSVSYKNPIWMKKAAFQYMYDHTGRSILDAYNNIIHVGHCHPHVVEAGQRAMANLNTNTRYIYQELAEYAAMLLAKFPKPLDKVFFVNSGSAASDLAIRIAKKYNESNKLIVMEHGYHGNTTAAIAASHYKYFHKGGAGQQEHIIQAEMPDSYRGRFQGETAGKQYADALSQQLQNVEDIAAFIAEPIIGCGGQVPLSKGYLKEIYPTIRKRGGLCISDEVQVGFGRLGSHYWGFEMHDVVPDVVILGKPIGNGHPMAAVVTTTEIADRFDNGMEFFSSFGGNPVSCQIGKAVLEVIENEGLQENADSVGSELIHRLNVLSQKHPCIGDVRGEGLFIGVDIISDSINLTPDTALASMIKNDLRNMNVLVSTDGPANNVIKIKAPLCFNLDNVDELVTKVDTILTRDRA